MYVYAQAYIIFSLLKIELKDYQWLFLSPELTVETFLPSYKVALYQESVNTAERNIWWALWA